MKKKLSVSSQPERLTTVSANSIFKGPLSKEQNKRLERIADQQARGDDSNIDYSDIPPISEEQMKTARRPNRELVAVRLDPDVLEWLKSFGPGYCTRINKILRTVMERSV